MSTDAELVAKYPELTEDDIKAYKVNRTKLYKGTIAVCIAYGVFAGLLLLLAIFDARGRQVLTEDMLPFVITLVGGMFFIIILLVIQVATSKPKALQRGIYDGDMCPDYWKLEKTPDVLKKSDVTNWIPTTTENSDRYLMKFRCVPDKDNVYDLNKKWDTTSNKLVDVQNADTNTFGQTYYNTNNTVYKTWDDAANKDIVNQKLEKASKLMYAPDKVGQGSNNKFVLCDRVYPELLAKEDAINFPRAPNTLRCKYADLCGIPWTGVCPKS